MRGVTRIEYPAHVAAVKTPRSTPPRSPDSVPPEPKATSATPANERSAPPQNRGGSDSVRNASPARPAKIGVAPRISPTTEADDFSSAYTKAIWLTYTNSAAPATNATSRRSNLSEPSTARASARNTSTASPYRTVA
jgi:hypothetical protein